MGAGTDTGCFNSRCTIQHVSPDGAFELLRTALTYDRIGYCTKVYFECHMSSYGSGSGLFSSGSRAGTFGSASSRQTYNRVMGLIKMQWRGFVMVLLIIFDVIFFCVIFVIFDNKASFSAAEVQRAEPWLICLALHEGNKYPCLHLTDPIVENEAIEVTVFVLLAVSSGLVKSANSF